VGIGGELNMTTGGQFDQGPYLSAALLCEKVLQEASGVKSAIRIIDRVTRTAAMPNPPREMEPFEYDINLLIKLKVGRVRGTHTIQIRLVKPSGESPPPIDQTALFEGEDDRGVDIVVNMHLKFDQPGTHWFDIFYDDNRLTKIPLRVVYIPQVIRIGPSSGELPPG
jgi:hypothetical protein